MSNWMNLNKFRPLCSSVFPLVKEEQLDDGTWDSFSTGPLGCFHVPVGWLGVVGWRYPHPLVLCPRLTLKGCETHLSCPFGNSPNEDTERLRCSLPHEGMETTEGKRRVQSHPGFCGPSPGAPLVTSCAVFPAYGQRTC